MPRNNKNNVLTTIIVPRAKQLRQQNPRMSQKQAIAKASAEYRQGKLGGNILKSVKGLVGNFL